MGMIENQIKELGAIYDELATNPELDCDINALKNDWAKKINEAMWTIKELSAKLHAAQMERNSIYYNDGWIPCEERLPKKFWNVLLQYSPFEDANEIMVGYRCPAGEFSEGEDTPTWFMNGKHYKNFDDVIAWRPLPELYQQKGEETNEI